MIPYNQTLIIIPTYNEIDNIEKMITKIFSISSDLSLLIVDDNSPDGTAAKVKEWQKKCANLHIVEREKKLGLGTAYVRGFKWGLTKNYQFFFEMDCDFSHDPDDIPLLLESAQKNDVVIGSRYIGGIRVINWPLKRLVLSLLASIYTRALTQIPVRDTTGGYKCLTRNALEAIDLDKITFKGYAFQIEMNYRLWSCGMRLKEVPIIFYERRNGKSKMPISFIFEAVFGVIKLRFRKMFGTL